MKNAALVLVCALAVTGCGRPARDATSAVTSAAPAPTTAAPQAVDGLGRAATPSPSTSRSPYDPGVDPVFATDPVLRRNETYTYRHTVPGDHALPAGTFTLRYDVATAGASPLKERLAAARASLVKATGVAIYLDGGTALDDADLAALQALHTTGVTKPTRLYVYNLRSLPGGKECTPTSGLPCAGQRARGGLSPYLWHNGWWDSWVRHLVLDDLEEVKAGAFSNAPFESVSLRAARTIGAMAFGHRPYAKMSVLYLPSARHIGRDAFRRNQYLTTVNLPRVTRIDDYAFDDTSRLRFFNAPLLVTIGRNALNDTHALKAVNLPRLEYIGINCFDLNADLEVLRLPRLKDLDKNGLTGFGALRLIYAPSLTTVRHDGITNNARLETVYVPKLSHLGPRALRNNPSLRAVRFGQRPPSQEADVFAATDPAKLTIYHTGDGAAWAGFTPAGNPAARVARAG